MAQTQTPNIFSKQGEMRDYTPASDTFAGDIVVVGSNVYLAAVDMASSATSTLGLLGVPVGGSLHTSGIWAINKDASTFADGDAVYWNATGNPVIGTAGTGCATSTAGSNKLIGQCVIPSGGAAPVAGDQYVWVLANVTKNTTTVAGSMTADDITGSDSSLGIAGLSSTQGGAVALLGGPSSTAGNAGGAVTAVGGTPGVTGVGGAVTLTGGAGGATSGTGGAASLIGGAGTNGNATGGAAALTGGAGQGTGTGGAANVTAGASGAGATGNGGAVTVTAGAAASTNGTGGAASLIGGLGTGTGAGGAITITSGAAGATGVAGAVNISVGGATAGNGSAVTITGGNGAGGTNSGGNVNLVPGAAVSTGTPGEVLVNSVSGFFDVQYNAPLMTTAVPASGTAQPIFMADRAYRVKAARACVVTHGTSEGFTITKDVSGTAPGGGTALLTTPILTTVANTPVAGTLISTVATLTLAAGDRLSFLTSGTIGSAAGLTMSVLLEPC